MGVPPVDDKSSDTLVAAPGEGSWTGSSTLPHLHHIPLIAGSAAAAHPVKARGDARYSVVTPQIRAQRPEDRAAVRAVLTDAFVDHGVVTELEASLEPRGDSIGFVAEVERQVVGHVRLTRGWVDALPRLVEVLVLSPLSVHPEFQRQGIGAALTRHAVEQAESMGAPAVFLEGSPAFYSRLGWRPAAELGVTPPSERIPLAALQAVRLSRWDDWMRGALVYAEPFWVHDCVGLRGERLEAATSTQSFGTSPDARATAE